MTLYTGEQLELKDVVNALWPTRSKFYTLGLNLDIDVGTLDTFKKKDIDDAFSDVIKTWLRRTPEPSWKVIVEALRKPSVKEETLANEIAKAHCPSELRHKGAYIELNNYYNVSVSIKLAILCTYHNII